MEFVAGVHHVKQVSGQILTDYTTWYDSFCQRIKFQNDCARLFFSKFIKLRKKFCLCYFMISERVTNLRFILAVCKLFSLLSSNAYKKYLQLNPITVKFKGLGCYFRSNKNRL